MREQLLRGQIMNRRRSLNRKADLRPQQSLSRKPHLGMQQSLSRKLNRKRKSLKRITDRFQKPEYLLQSI